MADERRRSERRASGSLERRQPPGLADLREEVHAIRDEIAKLIERREESIRLNEQQHSALQEQIDMLAEQLAAMERARQDTGAKFAEGTERFNALHQDIGGLRVFVEQQLGGVTTSLDALRSDLQQPLSDLALRLGRGGD